MASPIVQIKRNDSITALSSHIGLLPGELAFDYGNGILYIGAGSSSSTSDCIPINPINTVTLNAGAGLTGGGSYTNGHGIDATLSFALATSGVTAGSYGPSANATPGYGVTFNVPYITVDKYGRVTGASTKTVKIPASDNTNTSHTHTAGTGLIISGVGGTSGTTTYSANLNSTTSLGVIGTTSKLYAIGVDDNGQLCVNIPWSNTTYSVAKYNSLGLVKPAYTTTGAATLTTAAASNTATPTIQARTTNSDRYYAVEADKNGYLFVNVPWANTNTDTKVTQTVTTSNASYPLLLAPNGQTATATTTSYFDSGVTLNPSTNTITANISGTAARATHADNGVYYVEGGTGGTEGVWTGTNTNIPSLYTGLTIAYKIGTAGHKDGTTLNLTIANNVTTGDITVYRNTSNTTTQLPVNTVVILTYDGTGWRWSDYDSNSYAYVRQYSTSTNANYPLLFRYQVAAVSSGTYETKYVRFDSDSAIYANPSTGLLAATSFSGSGASLTNLNASNLSSGTVPVARLPVAAAATAGIVQGFHHTTGTSTGTRTTNATDSPAINSRTTTENRYYGIETDKAGKMYVNVPWANTTYAFENKGVTLAWGQTSTIATVGGTNITLTMPANPDTNTTYGVAKYNTLGLVKPAYTSTNSATLTTAAATNTTTPTIAAKTTTSGRYYAVEADKNGYMFVNVPWTNVNSDYVSKSSTSVQTVNGGLSIGGTPTAGTGIGRIMVTGQSNPLFGLQSVDGNGNAQTPYYLQVASDVLYLGPTSTKAMSFDSSGNIAMPATVTITNGALTVKTLYAPTSSGGTSYGAGSNKQVLRTNGTTVYWDSETTYTSLKNPYPLKAGTKSYDGSQAIEITAADLGLSSAMKFLGTSATAITDGATTNPITIGSTSTTVTNGNVVLYGSKEFVWTGSAWEELGNEGSYKIVQTAVSSPTASGNATAFIDTISQDTNGNITVTKKNVSFPNLSGGTAAAADAKVIGGVTVNGHAITAAQKTIKGAGSVTVSGTASEITITGVNTTYGVANHNTLGLVKPAYSSTGAATLTTAAATNTSTPTIAAKTTTAGRYYAVEIDKNGVLFVNVPWTDTNTNTTYSAGTGLSLNGTKFDHSNSITAGSVGSAQSPSHGGTFAIPKITYDAQGHITGATTVNITLPGDNNTDTKVTQTVTSSNASYPLLLAPNGQTTTQTTTSYFASGVTLNPSTNTITANISGNAATVTSVSNSALPLRLRNYQSSSTAADANSATETGFHYMATSGTNRPPFTNSTTNDYRILSTSYSASWVQQIATDFRCNELYYRRCENGTWKSWVNIPVADSSSTGSATQPVYLLNGVLKACTYTLGKSVPSDAKFTDTTYSAGSGLKLTSGAFSVNTDYTTSGKNYKVQVDSTSGGLYVNVPWTDTNTNTTYDADRGISLVSGKFGHSNTAITAGSVGSAQSPSHGGTFAIPKITYDAYGHITGATTVNITLPGDNNTDTKVTQNSSSANSNLPLLLAYSASPTSGTASTSNYGTGMYANPSTNTITATTFSGNATSATKATQDGDGNTITSTYLKLSGGNISGHVYFTGSQASSSTGNTSQIVFGTSSTQHVALSANDNALVINPTTSTTTNQIVLYLDKSSLFPKGITGNLTGNASTATKFASAQSIALTGDITGSASSQAGWSIATTLANSGVTAGSYGPSANASPAHGNTFSVPYFTVDAKGRVTAASTKTITLPADNNTDTKVTQNSSSANSNLPLLLAYQASPTSGTASTANYGTGIYANPSTNTITATTFSGNATSATKATQDGNGATISSTYLKLSGGTMTGTIKGTENTVLMNFRPANATYYATVSSQTAGNEALVFATANAVTSFMFVNGEDSVTNHDNNRWQSLTPGLQIKNNCVAINKLIANGVTPTYQLEVNGTIYGSSVWGAVWNDYAEFRNQSEDIKPGYCVVSADDGSVSKTIEKLQSCDGIVTDTFGFSIGKTAECKTPLAVAGRVLAYCEGNRYDYHSGDVVCAGPEGKVVKMTREEIKEYPDRIVGTVSEIPEYDTWGTGNVPVNGRIWIKVK